MSETRHVILIGINDYEVAPLEYCTNDADLIKECFIKYCGVKNDNIFPIKSSYNEPIENIEASFEKALQRIEANFQQEEDSIFFYFSGHGAKSGNSTAIMYKSKLIQLQDIFQKLSSLKPRFIFVLVDCCYSGIGIEDAIAKSAEEYYFAQQIGVAKGYNIFCASAHDRPAKEDSNLKNGRFTRLFCEIVQNKVNYKEGILSLSTIYQLLDEAFKNRPEFKQLPFSQNKGLSTYPLAYIRGEDQNPGYYSNHYIPDVEEYDWEIVINEIKLYGSVSNDTINEFVRLAREILRNSQKWGGATHLQIEISKNSATIIDNSGSYFDLFNPPKEVKQQGGAATAKAFSHHFAYRYELDVIERDNFIYQRFKFINQTEDPCKLSIGIRQLMKNLVKGQLIEIPGGCKEFIIELPQGLLDLSWSAVFLDTVIESSKKSGVPVIIRIAHNDRLKENIIEALLWKKDVNNGNVSIEYVKNTKNIL
jgi:hypothetical protein